MYKHIYVPACRLTGGKGFKLENESREWEGSGTRSGGR